MKGKKKKPRRNHCRVCRRPRLTDEQKAENRRKLIASLKDDSTKQLAIREFAKLGLFQ